MARRTRTRRLLTTVGITAVATGTVLAPLPAAHAEPPEATADATASVTVRPDPSYQQERFEGWGTSVSETLCVPEGFRLFGRGVAVCWCRGVRTSG